jgi:hypothetical protein
MPHTCAAVLSRKEKHCAKYKDQDGYEENARVNPTVGGGIRGIETDTHQLIINFDLKGLLSH